METLRHYAPICLRFVLYLSDKLLSIIPPSLYEEYFSKLNSVVMNIIKVIFLFLCATQISAQCDNCSEINHNGNFEQKNNIPGTENANGIMQGEIQNWYNTHGSADYFDNLWNWYYIDGVESNMGHLCYGSRPSHDHSEGMYTSVDILADEDLSYCVQFDYGSHCDSDKNGKAHIYLANNLQEGSTNGFMFPKPQTHGYWFDNSKEIDVIELDDETSFTEVGMTTYSATIDPDESYSQLWFFTEYLYADGGFANCGLMLDNVKVSCTTSALTEISVEDLGDDSVELSAVFSKELSGVTYEWITDNSIKSTQAKLIINKTEKSQEVCLKITDSRGACAEVCVTVSGKNGSHGQSLCDYAVCLDAAGGVPTIEGIELKTETGETITIDNSFPEFDFPYCIGAWNMCADGAYELEHLVTDLNIWMLNNDYQGQVAKTEDSGIIEGCRANKLLIFQSELSFESLIIGNEKEMENYSIYFQQANCNEIPNEESETTNAEETQAYPNPAVGIVNVTLPQAEQNNSCSIELRCLNGNILESHDVDISQNNTMQLDLSQRQAGIYYINVRTESAMESHKIIKL